MSKKGGGQGADRSFSTLSGPLGGGGQLKGQNTKKKEHIIKYELIFTRIYKNYWCLIGQLIRAL